MEYVIGNSLISWKLWSLLLFTIIVMAAAACSNDDFSTIQNDNTESDGGGFAVPEAIRASPIDPNCVSAWASFDGGPREQMLISNNGAKLEKELSLGDHTILIEFECEDPTFGIVLLASAERSVVVVPEGNELSINQQEYLPLPDSDGDTINNLVELENGTDPSEKLAIVFVSIDDPNASDDLSRNDGTKKLPFSSINTAINYLVGAGQAAFPGEVRVAMGTYDGNFQNQTHIVLAEGISLFGSYSLDWSARDANATSTVIRDTSSIGGFADNPNRAIEASNALSTSSVIDGFDIQGGSGDLSAGIFIIGASPTISNNKIDGGSATGGSRGIVAINGSAPVIRGNTITAGSGLNSISVLNKSGSSSLIENNRIRGGTNILVSSQSIGIANFGGGRKHHYPQ